MTEADRAQAAAAERSAALAAYREAADCATAEPRTPAEADEALLLAKTFLSAAKVEV